MINGNYISGVVNQALGHEPGSTYIDEQGNVYAYDELSRSVLIGNIDEIKAKAKKEQGKRVWVWVIIGAVMIAATVFFIRKRKK